MFITDRMIFETTELKKIPLFIEIFIEEKLTKRGESVERNLKTLLNKKYEIS